MSALFKMIWSGEAFGLLGMIFVLGYVGRFLIPFDRESARLSTRLAGATFIVYALYRVVVDRPASVMELFATLLSSLLVSLLVMTAAWVLLPPLLFLYKRYQPPDSEANISPAEPEEATASLAKHLFDLVSPWIPDKWRTHLQKLALSDVQDKMHQSAPTNALSKEKAHRQDQHVTCDEEACLRQVALCDELYTKNLQRIYARISESTYARLRQNYLQQITDSAVVTRRAEMIRALILRSAKNHDEQGALTIENFNSPADIQQYFFDEIRSIESGAWDQTDKEILLTGIEVEMDIAMTRATK